MGVPCTLLTQTGEGTASTTPAGTSPGLAVPEPLVLPVHPPHVPPPTMFIPARCR